MKLRTFILRFCLCFLGISFIGACDKTNDDLQPQHEMSTHSDKAALLHNLSTIRILAIGNSYSWDGASYLADILYHAGVSSSDYCLYIMSHDAASLEYWASRLETESVDSIHKCAGKIDMPTSKGTFANILNQNWDIVVLQQYSGYASNYSTYSPYIERLAKAIHQNSTNPNILLAWNLIHSYSSDYCAKVGISSPEQYWMGIANAASMVMDKNKFDLLIPTGTAIQNARNSTLNTEHELTRDGSHLCYGIGRYVAACTWAEALFAPVFDFNIIGNNSIIDQQFQSGLSYLDSWVPVTESNKELCQLCAYYACQNPYKITYHEDEKRKNQNKSNK